MCPLSTLLCTVFDVTFADIFATGVLESHAVASTSPEKIFFFVFSTFCIFFFHIPASLRIFSYLNRVLVRITKLC